MKKMKVFSCLLACALLVAALGLFVGCGGGEITYENAEDYTAGDFDTDEKITSVEIYWQGGEVLLKSSISSKLHASEERESYTDPKMYHAVKDGVLRIYPCASGESVGDADKELTVLVPYSYSDSIESILIVCEGDTEVVVNDVATESLTVNADTAPVMLKGKLGAVTVTTTTGDLHVESQRTEALTFTSDKGDASLSLQTGGFVAVMQGGGSFESEYETHRDGNAYRYGNQSLPMVFDTRGEVSLKEYKTK